MNKIIAIGDVHGSTKWRDIVNGNKDSRIVFWGDYLDPYGTYDAGEILDNLIAIIDFKRNNMDSVVLLLGNHDLHYISSEAEPCTRFDIHLADKAESLFMENIRLFQYAYQMNNIIFTHAGISHRWFEKNFKGNISHNIADQLNNPDDEQIEALFCVGEARGGESGRIGGIFWADRFELKDPLHGFTQVVGHNRVQNITEMAYTNDNKIIFCDCLGKGKYCELHI